MLPNNIRTKESLGLSQGFFVGTLVFFGNWTG